MKQLLMVAPCSTLSFHVGPYILWSLRAPEGFKIVKRT